MALAAVAIQALNDARRDTEAGEFDAALGHACDALVVLWDLKRSRRRGLEHVSQPIARVMADLSSKIGKG